MSILVFSLAIGAMSFGAGLLGALTGLGGGVVIVPMLTLLFGVDIRYAIGASLVSVIATSSGAAAAYVQEGYTNIRIGIFLEVATTLGAVVGGIIATKMPTAAIAVLFGLMLIVSAWFTRHPRDPSVIPTRSSPLALHLGLEGTQPGPDGPRPYFVRGVPAGFALMGLAGLLSSLLGIGSGAVKVLALDRMMQLPFKVSTTTSNFMIGVTAATGAGVYLSRGYIDPALAMPVMLGVLAGSMLGARLLLRVRAPLLRKVFAVVILILAVEMIAKGLAGFHDPT